MIDRYRDIVNFDFWKASCEAEVTEPALRARERTWVADKEFGAARLQAAKAAYEESFAAWREVLDASKVLREDPLTADDIAEVVDRYRKLLEQLDEPFPKSFVLQDVVDMLAFRAADKGLEFLLDVGADVPSTLVGDPLRLLQVLANLCSNAIKFTDQGSVVVSVRRTRPSGWLYLRALVARFWSACSRRMASAETVTCGGTTASN